MKCDICREQQAVFFVRTSSSELHLCESCAKKQGYHFSSRKTGGGESSLIDIFAGILSTESNSVHACPNCGILRSEIRRTGRAGCACCYTQFSTDVASLRREEGGLLAYTGSLPESYGAASVEDSGKRPASGVDAGESSRAAEIKFLQDELRLSVGREDYEKAAYLRDRLKELEGNDG